MEVLYAFTALLLTSVVWAFLWARKKTKYFAERGIPHEKPILFIGNNVGSVLRGISAGERMKDLCLNQFKNEPIFGVFDFFKPFLVVNDIEHVHRVLIKDFQHFVDHGFDIDEKRNPYEISLFAMNGNRWRAFRHKFSPMFTSGKLKDMSKQMTTLSENFVNVLAKRDLNDVDLRELAGQLSMDVIGSCGYGIDCKNLGNEDSEYRKMGKRLFEMDVWRYAKFMLLLTFPGLFKKLSIGFNPRDIIVYFRSIVEDTMEHRGKNSYKRNDFVQLMLTLKERGSIDVTTRDSSDDYLGLESLEQCSTETFEFSQPEIVGHAISFLTAGFEATALALLFLCYDLSVNPKVQEMLRKEVKRVVFETDGKITYDAVKNMPYLSMCLNESQRLHSFVPELFRVCTKEYTFPGTNITLKPGDAVKIPVAAIHMNPDIYPEPEQFNPDRFIEGVERPPCSFLPFGDGPRMCIAMRFAMLQVKVAAAYLVHNFTISLSPKSKPLKYDPYSIALMPKDKLYFNLDKC